MTQTTTLPARARKTLILIEAGEPLIDQQHVQWAQAFAQMKWIVAIEGRWVLTKDGAIALRDCDAEIPAVKRSKRGG